MIRYSLTCAEGHDFESWFASAAAFDELTARGLVNCGICGGHKVSKALMAPAVTQVEAARGLRQPQTKAEEVLAALRREIEATSEYVGSDFASEARRMFEGDTPERTIHGEARLEEARKLVEDGVPVAPLPFLPRGKTN